VTTVFHTVVTKLPPTPLGLLPARWHIEHRCTTCRQLVPSVELLAHAQDHHPALIEDLDDETDEPSKAPTPGDARRRRPTGGST
jgi:hypothetical protein